MSSSSQPYQNYSKSYTSLDDVLDVAVSHKIEPSLEVLRFSDKQAFAAVVAVYNQSGERLGAWTSEPMFGSSEAALEHAGDMVSSELFVLI
jgi:hypothetical protein